MITSDFAIIGAGLAGCECALALGRSGYTVTLFEQKPQFKSPAHTNDDLAELVCSNSFRSNEAASGPGLLKQEMRLLNSAILQAAECFAVPAGKSLATDRNLFSAKITELIESHPRINLVRRRIDSLEDPILQKSGPLGVVMAAGPLASDELAASLASITGQEFQYFYDAIAPVVWSESLNMETVFRASRYGGENEPGDYLNCPMNREEYSRFYNALLAGEIYAGHGESATHFEGCMPIEALAARGEKTLAFGPLRPVGLTDPRTGKRPWAVLQLRPENANSTTCNLVGCQTKLLQKEQKRIFSLVPGMENAEFVRFGSMHRNTYVNAPQVLGPLLELKNRPHIHLAGQITGVEGYVESAASGLWLGLALAARANGRDLPAPPPECAYGALLAHLRRENPKFQPSNIHFGLMPEFAEKIRKKDRKLLYSERGQKAFAEWLNRMTSTGTLMTNEDLQKEK